MLNLYLKLSLTWFKNNFQQKQLALYKSYASTQSGNPELSQACNIKWLKWRKKTIRKYRVNKVPSF